MSSANMKMFLESSFQTNAPYFKLLKEYCTSIDNLTDVLKMYLDCRKHMTPAVRAEILQELKKIVLQFISELNNRSISPLQRACLIMVGFITGVDSSVLHDKVYATLAGVGNRLTMLNSLISCLAGQTDGSDNEVENGVSSLSTLKEWLQVLYNKWDDDADLKHEERKAEEQELFMNSFPFPDALTGIISMSSSSLSRVLKKVPKKDKKSEPEKTAAPMPDPPAPTA